jgi:hypothetical protein
MNYVCGNCGGFIFRGRSLVCGACDGSMCGFCDRDLCDTCIDDFCGEEVEVREYADIAGK